MNRLCLIGCIVAAFVGATSLAAGQTVPGAATQSLTNTQLRQRLALNVKEIVSDDGSMENLLRFLGNKFVTSVDVDWAGLEKAGVTRFSGITLSVKNVPVERALLEIIEDVAPNQLTYVLDRGRLKIRLKDDTREGRHAAAAALMDQAQVSLDDGDKSTAVALLAQAHILEPGLNPELLPQALVRLAPSLEPMNFSADGRIRILTSRDAWLKVHVVAQARLDSILQDLTVEQQPLVKVLYYFHDTMNIQGQYVNWPQLEKLGVTRDSGVTLRLNNQPAGLALNAILAAAGKGKLGFVSNDNILTISTLDDLDTSPRYQRIWVYDVRALIPSVGTDRDAALDRAERARKLLAIVKSAADEKSWVRGGRFVDEYEGLLFVRQDDLNHVKIAQRLAELKKL
jgi:hypothetical protein